MTNQGYFKYFLGTTNIIHEATQFIFDCLSKIFKWLDSSILLTCIYLCVCLHRIFNSSA